MVEPLSLEAIERAQKNFIPKESKPLSTGQTSNFKRLDVPAYLNKYGIEIVKTKSNGGSILYCLKRCVFDESHANNEAAIGQTTEGKLFYQCFHNSCKGRTWHEARQIISGDDPLFEREYRNEIAEERAAIQAESREAEQNKPRFEFIHNSEILKNLRPTQWRIKNVMEDNILYYDFGDVAHFKTFVGLDRLLHIATGIDYHGHKVKQGTVFYIAGEGQQGIGRRIAAWHIHHKTSAKDVPFFVARTPTQLMDKGAVEEVKRAVDYMSAQYGPPAIIHIDTLARNFGEGDENSTKDMNRIISNMDTAFGTNIGRGLTHHTGHMNKDRARGSYALHGAVDSAFRIEYRQDETILVTCKKMKDAPFAPAMLFDTIKILLQIGDQHDSSFVLDLSAEGDAACKTDGELQKVEAVITALREMGGQVDSQAPLKNAVQVELNCSEATARRAINEALELRKIIIIPGKGKGKTNFYALPDET